MTLWHSSHGLERHCVTNGSASPGNSKWVPQTLEPLSLACPRSRLRNCIEHSPSWAAIQGVASPLSVTKTLANSFREDGEAMPQEGKHRLRPTKRFLSVSRMSALPDAINVLSTQQMFLRLVKKLPGSCEVHQQRPRRADCSYLQCWGLIWQVMWSLLYFYGAWLFITFFTTASRSAQD
jgi:hypothetical protein